MQAMNIAIIDQMVTHMEYELLAEYIQIERTPLDTMIQVSALSQMWTFSVYELLRTWRQRIRDFRKQFDNGMLAQRVARLRDQAEADHSAAALLRAIHADRVLTNPKLLNAAEGHVAATKPVFNLVEILRMNLAKHASPGAGHLAQMPGYGRIDMQCGSVNFHVVCHDRSISFVSRRDIAEAIRRLQVPPINLDDREAQELKDEGLP
jgi:hypothetical protein